MKTLKKHLKLKGFDYFVKHLKIISAFLPVPLTSKEIDVLAKFLELNYPTLICTSSRKEVRDALNLSHGSLGNYLKSLEEKKYISKNEEDYIIFPAIIPNRDSQTYMFKLDKDV